MSANLYPSYHGPSRLNNFAFRSYALARDLTRTPGLFPAGQEPVNLVQYVPDREYRPHCDGECNGRPFKIGDRIATAIAYCQSPSAGGATTFTTSGLKIEPVANSLLFFAYRHLDDHGTMDNGQTEHSGCPITGGEKFIAVQWFRDGVTQQRPWDFVRAMNRS